MPFVSAWPTPSSAKPSPTATTLTVSPAANHWRDLMCAWRTAWPGPKRLGEGAADDELPVEEGRRELLGEVDLGFVEVGFAEHAAGRRAGRNDERASPDLDDDRQVDVPGRAAFLAAQADAALAPEAHVRRQIRLDALARREVQARIELADDDLDAGRRRRRRLVEGERRGPGRRGRRRAPARVFRVAGQRRDEQAAGDEKAPTPGGAARRARAERAGRSTACRHCRSGARRPRARTGRERPRYSRLCSPNPVRTMPSRRRRAPSGPRADRNPRGSRCSID